LTQAEEHLADSLGELHKARERCNLIIEHIRFHIEEQPSVKLAYERFLKSGGVTGDDFRALIHTGFDLPPVRRNKLAATYRQQ
jgi:hypothetical protein